jgi:hypothetical protein
MARVRWNGTMVILYTGQWKNDVQNGTGKLTKKNGDVFEGQFRNGKVDGDVSIHYANGNTFRGVYQDGQS